LDRILPEGVNIREVIYRGSDTGVSLHESSKRRKVEDGVARKMMGLEFKKVKKAPEEVKKAERPKPRLK
jgi:hypothetical protein